VARARPSSGLVQVRGISFTRCRRSAGILTEFGLRLDEDVEIRVWDSTAEIRYLVLPERPSGSEGLSEDELAALVTRDAMIGVAKAAPPRRVPA
jgi:nitrile hydratase subunit alpha